MKQRNAGGERGAARRRRRRIAGMRFQGQIQAPLDDDDDADADAVLTADDGDTGELPAHRIRAPQDSCLDPSSLSSSVDYLFIECVRCRTKRPLPAWVEDIVDSLPKDWRCADNTWDPAFSDQAKMHDRCFCKSSIKVGRGIAFEPIVKYGRPLFRLAVVKSPLRLTLSLLPGPHGEEMKWRRAPWHRLFEHCPGPELTCGPENPLSAVSSSTTVDEVRQMVATAEDVYPGRIRLLVGGRCWRGSTELQECLLRAADTAKVEGAVGPTVSSSSSSSSSSSLPTLEVGVILCRGPDVTLVTVPLRTGMAELLGTLQGQQQQRRQRRLHRLRGVQSIAELHRRAMAYAAGIVFWTRQWAVSTLLLATVRRRPRSSALLGEAEAGAEEGEEAKVEDEEAAAAEAAAHEAIAFAPCATAASLLGLVLRTGSDTTYDDVAVRRATSLLGGNGRHGQHNLAKMIWAFLPGGTGKNPWGGRIPNKTKDRARILPHRARVIAGGKHLNRDLLLWDPRPTFADVFDEDEDVGAGEDEGDKNNDEDEDEEREALDEKRQDGAGGSTSTSKAATTETTEKGQHHTVHLVCHPEAGETKMQRLPHVNDVPRYRYNNIAQYPYYSDSICFKADIDITLTAIGLFGGRPGTFWHVENIWLLLGTVSRRNNRNLRPDNEEPNILVRVEDRDFESEGMEPVRVDMPTHKCSAGEWYTISIRMNSRPVGAVSFSGTGGRTRAAVDSAFKSEKVNFEFRNATGGSNGTGYSMGQVPCFWFIAH